MNQVLVVDDDPQVCSIVVTMLERNGYVCHSAATVKEARGWLEEDTFDLVLSDVTMPGESGIELARYVTSTHPQTAVLIMSAIDDPAVADGAVDIGVHGYLVKPFNLSQLLVDVSNALRKREREQERMRESRLELRKSREDTLRRLAKAAEFRDGETGRHIERMGEYCGAIARKLGFGSEHAALIRLASPLHDVGKIAVPDWILLKPGPLTPAERELMQKHAEVGYLILTGSGEELLELAASMAWTHHERLDGSGYPRGLKGDEIPLEGRIVAVGDVFDALTSDRVYRRAMSVDDAIQVLEEGRGTHYDPAILDALLAVVSGRRAA
jgi:putative two-component system response regulator